MEKTIPPNFIGALLNTPIYVGETDLEPQVSPILDNIVAFLVFMALKVKPKVSPKFLKLVDYN